MRIDMSREPVRNAQYIAAAIQAVIMLFLGMAVSLGWISLDASQTGAIEKFVAAVLALAVLIGPQLAAAFWARNQVTPLADPKTPDGQPAILLPMATAQAMGIAPWEGGNAE